jgi:hypothetical protein
MTPSHAGIYCLWAAFIVSIIILLMAFENYVNDLENTSKSDL